MSTAGALRFARYTLAPNLLGYCGPADGAELAGALGAGDAAVVSGLAPAFAAAYPYLALIAGSAGIDDPLDDAVVAAYWLGGPLAAGVPPRLLAAHLASRLDRLHAGGGDGGPLAAANGAPCAHALHVLGVSPFGELVHSAAAGTALAVCDACRIRRARVVGRAGERLEVRAERLAVVGGRLVHAPPVIELARLPAGVAPTVGAGDVVALHWGVVCERLSPAAAAALAESTARTLSALATAPRALAG